MDEFEKIKNSVKNQPLLKDCLKNITEIRKKISEINKDGYNKDIQQEYKLLIQGNEKCLALFTTKFNKQTFTAELSPKNEKCQKIINSLLNEKYLKEVKQQFDTQEITLSNISQFRSHSFIGSSTMDLKLKQQEKSVRNEIHKKMEQQKEETNSQMDTYEQKLKKMNEDLLRQLQEVKEELNKVKKGKGKQEETEEIKNFRKIFIKEEQVSEDEIQHEVSFSKGSDPNLNLPYNRTFPSQEEKESYFDNLFGRNKPGNLSIDELEQKYNNLIEETYPDIKNGTEEQQLYYYKTHPKNFGSSQ